MKESKLFLQGQFTLYVVKCMVQNGASVKSNGTDMKGGLEMKYPILCKVEIGYSELQSELEILEMPVERIVSSGTTSEPNVAKEAQKQR